ncbi:MAG: cysteine peptidase family C39 domain-containing protein [Patescibacteria group bacterium]
MLSNEEEKIKIDPFFQSPGLCGPASLKMLLSYFGKQYTEEQLAKLGSSTIESGTEHEGMIQAAKEIGGFVFMKENGTMEELEYFIREEKLPVIIGWFDKDGDHYSVVVSITDKNIIIVDPASREPERWLDKSTFLRIWFDFIGEDNKTVSWNWFMVVTFEKRKFKLKGGYYY